MDDPTRFNDVPTVLIQLRRNALQTSNSSRALDEIERHFGPTGVLRKPLESGDEDTVNVLKYAARLHGLPPSLQRTLQALLAQSIRLPITSNVPYKMSLALKYAVANNPDFIPVGALLHMLEDLASSEVNKDGNAFLVHLMTELMQTTLLILTPSRITAEAIDKATLCQLENYLGFFDQKLKTEVKRALERLGIWLRRDASSYPGYGTVTNGTSQVQSGAQVIASIQKRARQKVASHVVKTQQIQAVKAEENVSEKSQISNVSLTNVMDRRRAKTEVMQQMRAKQVLPPPKATGDSEIAWYRTTADEVVHFLTKAKGRGPLCPDDLKYLVDKFVGFKFSFAWSYSLTQVMEMIAETFHLISEYQQLETDTVVALLIVAFLKDIHAYPEINFNQLRLHILKATDRHCLRLKCVPPVIFEFLTQFRLSPEGKNSRDDVNDLLLEILFLDETPENVLECLKVAILGIESEKSSAQSLKFIRRQIFTPSRKPELEQVENLVQSLVSALVHFQARDYERSETIQETLEDYLNLSWTKPLNPDQLLFLTRLPKQRGTTCIILSMEKGFLIDPYFKQFSSQDLRPLTTYLFGILSSPIKDGFTKAITVAMMSSVMEKPELKPYLRLATDEHVQGILQLLLKEEILLKENNICKLVDSPDGLKDEDEAFEFVADYASKLMLLMVSAVPFLRSDEVLKTVVKAFKIGRGKNTKINCSELLFITTSDHAVVLCDALLEQVKDEIDSEIADVHVYATATYCTSLANQAKAGAPLIHSEQVGFLLELYSFNGIVLSTKDFTNIINHSILEVIHHIFKIGGDISDNIFSLLGTIMTNASVDSYESSDYENIKTILASLKLYSARNLELPLNILVAIENVFLSSDLFADTCGEILEKWINKGKPVSPLVLEEFGKQLWREKKFALNYLERLSIANENQELPDHLFNTFQMEFTGLRLGLRLHDGSNHNLIAPWKIFDLFKCLFASVSSGMQLTKHNFEVVTTHLKIWRDRKDKKELENLPLRNLIVQGLTNVVQNGQSLPPELCRACFETSSYIGFIPQLELAKELIQRGQKPSDIFVRKVFSEMQKQKQKVKVDKKTLGLISAMILNNQIVPQDILRLYCATIINYKNSLLNNEILGSMTRIIETKQVKKGSEEMSNCKQMFFHAIQSKFPAVVEAGIKGFKMLEMEDMLDEDEIDQISRLTKPTCSFGDQQSILKGIEALQKDNDWRNKLGDNFLGQLEKELMSSPRFFDGILKLLFDNQGELNAFEEFVLETIRICMIRNQVLEEVMGEFSSIRRILSELGRCHGSSDNQSHDLDEENINQLAKKVEGAIVDGSFSICKLIIGRVIEDGEISLQILENITKILTLSPNQKEPSTINEFRVLMELIRSEFANIDLIQVHLSQMIAEEKAFSVQELSASIKSVVALSHLPKAEKNQLINQMKLHVNKLMSKNYDYILLSKVIRNVVETPAILLESLENVLCQLLRYQVGKEGFAYICSKLEKTKKNSELIEVCNQLLIEQLFSSQQGAKTPTEMTKEFQRLNGVLVLPNFLSNFERIMNEQNAYSSGTFSPINSWDESQIKSWSKRKKEEKNAHQNNLKEWLAVINRAFYLSTSYTLKSIQVMALIAASASTRMTGGRLLQVATGAGKSTIIACLAALKCLEGNKVDIYTSNEVLAERDAKEWASFYKLFGLTSDHNGDKGNGYIKGVKSCYKKDIVYGDTSQFQFDTLRDEYSGLGTRACRKFGFAIVDEVDSMFVDDTSKLARLTSSMPGIDMLQTIYHLIHHRLHDIERRLIAVKDQIYYLEGRRTLDEKGQLFYTFATQNATEERTVLVINFILENETNPQALLEALITPVKDIDSFVTEHLKEYTRALLGDYAFPENPSDIQKLPLPKHLLVFARTQVDNWVSSALTAQALQENVDYVVDDGKIKPVDFHSTGVVQGLTNWNNGLHQFLQLKHNLKLSSETLTTNFMSNMAMFQKYGTSLVGFTGTLGSEHGQQVLRRVYGVETLIIPDLHHKRFKMIGEKTVNTRSLWVNEIAFSANHEAFKGRAVLIICQTIREAEQVAKELQDAKLYTRNDLNQDRVVQQVYPGDKIVATNLAGRGTDINTARVEEQGGLHVILTFLPDSLRVEEQAFGRTARQGKKGTGELILLNSILKTEELKAKRDEEERRKLDNFQENEMKLIQAKDKLFSKFCSVFSRIRDEFRDPIKAKLGMESLTILAITRLQAIEQEWAGFLKKIDDGIVNLEEADANYFMFEAGIEAAYKDQEKSFNLTNNCFYWTQIGNDYYSCWNFVKDNTGEALKYFEKGISLDPDFAAGAYAGLAFCMLRGKQHLLWANSHQEKYKRAAIKHLKTVQKILATEIGYHATAQGLLLSRGGGTDSELFKQLTEKMGLIGEYINCMEAIISAVEKSLRAVYAIEVEPSGGRQRWRLDDDKPVLDSRKKSAKFNLEFNDLTCFTDMWSDDQAIKTIGDWGCVSLIICDADLKKLIELVGKSTKNILSSVELGQILNIRRLLEKLVVTSDFTLKIGTSAGINFLSKLGDVARGKMARVAWTDGELERTTVIELGTGRGYPDANEISLEIDYGFQEDVKEIEEFLSDEPNVFIILKELSEYQIKKDWTNPEPDQVPGILQSFNENKVTLQFTDKKAAKEVIKTLRKNNINFVLRLDNLTFTQAVEKLNNLGRAQEEMKEKRLRKMGDQFSSSYIPLDLILELVQRGIVYMPEFIERGFIPWRSVIAMGILASTQIATGALLICTGFGASVGLGLVTEGFVDYVTTYRITVERDFTWGRFAIQKSISLTISAASIGLASLRGGPEGVMAALKAIGEEFEQQTAQRLLTEGAKKVFTKAQSNLSELVAKQIATQAVETVARVGLNTMVDALVQFSFDRVRDHLEKAVEIVVARELRAPECFELLSTCIAIHEGDFITKLSGWIGEVTRPQAITWNSIWDSVGYPLCQGLLSDAGYVGSKFSLSLRLVGAINGCREIATVAMRVCGYILKKLQNEIDLGLYTPSNCVKQKFGVYLEEAHKIVSHFEFGSSSFHVEKVVLADDIKSVNMSEVKICFDKMHKSILNFKVDGEEMSRIIKLVTDQITDQIIYVADRQLAKPITTGAVGQLVSSISQSIQSNYLVSDKQNSSEQEKVKVLKEKESLNKREEEFLQSHDKPVTFSEQIRGNASDLIGAATGNKERKRSSSAFTFGQIQKTVKKVLNKKNEQYLSNGRNQQVSRGPFEWRLEQILDGDTIDLTTAFILFKLSSNVKLASNLDYELTEEERESKIIIITWEELNENVFMPHSVIDSSGVVKDIVWDSVRDEGLNIISSVTGEKVDELKKELESFALCSAETFNQFSNQCAVTNSTENHQIEENRGLSDENGTLSEEEVTWGKQNGLVIPFPRIKFGIERKQFLLVQVSGNEKDLGSLFSQDMDENASDLLSIIGSAQRVHVLYANGEELGETTGLELEGLLGTRISNGFTFNGFISAPLTSNCKSRISLSFRSRCKSFLEEVKTQGLIENGEDDLLNQEYSLGKVGFVVNSEGRLIPLVESVTCIAKMKPPERLCEEEKQRLQDLFGSHLYPRDLPETLNLKVDDEDEMSCGATFSNMEMCELLPIEKYKHSNALSISDFCN